MNKKKLLALLMALVMTLSLVPVTAFATGNTATLTQDGVTTECQDFGYAYVAIDKNGGPAVITLLEDHSYNLQMQFTTPFTLDLNGHTLKNEYTSYPFITGANLVIQDTSASGNGVFLADHTSNCALAVANGATVTLKSGTIQSENAIFAINANGTVNIEGGKVVSHNKYGTADSRGLIYYAKQPSYLNISGGEFRSDQSARYWDDLLWDDGFDPVYYKAASTLNEGANVTVTGGTFSGQRIQRYVHGYTADQELNDNNPTITVGDYTITRSSVISNCGAAPYDVYVYTVEAKNYVAQIGEGENVSKYVTLDAAYEAANTGDTITLLTDITYGTDREVPVWTKAVNLNLGGHILTTNSTVSVELGNMGYKAAAVCYSIPAASAGNVTVSNGTIVTAYGAGVYADDPGLTLTLENVNITANTVSPQQTNEYSSAIRITGGAHVIINSGSYSGYHAIAASNSGADFTVNGGTFNGDVFFSNYTDNGKTKSVIINGGQFNNGFTKDVTDDTLVINGGVFTAAAKTSAESVATLGEGKAWANNHDTATSADYPHTVAQPVAQIGNVKYETLQAAIDNAQDDDTIVMLENVDLASQITTENKSFTLDLNGKTISKTAPSTWAIRFNGNGSDSIITIKDTSEGGNGKITSSTVTATVLVNNATLNLESGTIEGAPNDKNGPYALYAGGSGTVNVQGGSIVGYGYGAFMTGNSTLNTTSGSINATKTTGYAILTNGSSGQNATINIHGGNIGSDVNGPEIGIYMPSGSLSVTAGTITGKTGVYFKSTNLNISGGTIIGTGAKADYVYNSNGCVATGDAVVIDNCNYPSGAPTAYIKDADIASTNGKQVGYYVYNNSPEGTVLADKAYTLSTNVVKGWVDNTDENTSDYSKTIGTVSPVAQIGDDESKQYPTLEDAVDAAQDNDTINLIADDIAVTSTIEITKSITINGNGNTINATGTGSGYALYVDEDTAKKKLDVVIRDLNMTTTRYQVAVMLNGSDLHSTLALNHVDITCDGECIYANGHTYASANNCNFTHEGIYAPGKDFVYYSALIVGYGGSLEVSNCTVTSFGNGAATFPSGGFITLTNTDISINNETASETNAGYAIWSRNEDYTNLPEYNCDSVITFHSGKVSGGFKITDKYPDGDAKNVHDPKIVIDGGVFSTKPAAAYIETGYAAMDNDDPATYSDYPYKVDKMKVEESASATVTVEQESSLQTGVATEDYNSALNNAGVAQNEAVTVSGVVLTMDKTVDNTKTGVQAVVDAARTKAVIDNNDAFISSLDSPATVKIDVDVKVTPTKYDPTGDKVLTFDLTPYATVTVTKGNETPVSVDGVKVTNEMIDKDQPIFVKLYTGEEPKILLHICGTTTESLTKGSEATLNTFKYDNADGYCEFYVNHFSDIKAILKDSSEGGFLEIDGGSLRRRVLTDNRDSVINYATDLRLRFKINLPEDAEIVKEEGKSYFAWGLDESMSYRTPLTSTSTEYAALIINRVKAAQFNTEIYCQLHLTYRQGDQEYTMVCGPMHRSVTYIANVMAEADSSSGVFTKEWIDYGKFLLGRSGDEPYNLSTYKNNN